MGTAILLSLLVIYLRTRLPSTASFEAFFRTWFTEDYFPKISQKVQKELQARAKQQNFLDSLATSFRGWVMGKTEGLQAATWYELYIKMVCLPASYGDVFFMRTATVNLGSHGRPCFVTFWGILDRWMLSPLVQVDFEN